MNLIQVLLNTTVKYCTLTRNTLHIYKLDLWRQNSNIMFVQKVIDNNISSPENSLKLNFYIPLMALRNFKAFKTAPE